MFCVCMRACMCVCVLCVSVCACASVHVCVSGTCVHILVRLTIVMSQSWFSNLLASTAFTHIVDYAVKTLAYLTQNNSLPLMNGISYAYVCLHMAYFMRSEPSCVQPFSGFVQTHYIF